MNKELLDLIDKKEEEVTNQLKPFQKETVKKVIDCFNNGQTRVLVSDEVGLGKTYIALGTSSKLCKSLSHKNEKQGKWLFRVAYICGNESIARQNIKKLSDVNSYVEFSNSRLSMIYFATKLNEVRLSKNGEKTTSILIPLSPATSFNIGSQLGLKEERILLYCILDNLGIFDDCDKNLIYSLFLYGYKDNPKQKNEYIKNIKEIEDFANNQNSFMKKELNHYKKNLNDLVCFFKSGQVNKENFKAKLLDIRKVFANIGASMLEPNLIIMDEFQRFRNILDSTTKNKGNETDLEILVNKFLKNNSSAEGKNKPYILLLSATPYSVYSSNSCEEGCELNQSYKDFNSVLSFLNNDTNISLVDEWSKYINKVQSSSKITFDELKRSKDEIEKSLYSVMARTERISANIDKNYIKVIDSDLIKNISKEDLNSFKNIKIFLKQYDASKYVTVEFAKNTPYIASFLNEYKAGSEIQSYFRKGFTGIKRSKNVKLEWNDILHYKKIPTNNSKMHVTFQNTNVDSAYNLLFLPPSFPYYSLKGPFADERNKNFTKTLIFSSWVMIPRAISTLLSYESERLNMAPVPKTKEWANSYTRKYSAGFKVRSKYFSLIYPSIYGASLWGDENIKNPNCSLEDLKEQIKCRLLPKFNDIKKIYCKADNTNNKDDWYNLFLPIVDNRKTIIIKNSEETDDKETSSLYKALQDKLQKALETKSMPEYPDDLLDVVTNNVIGSPAICLLRAFNCSDEDTITNCQIIAHRIIVSLFGNKEGQGVIYPYKEKNQKSFVRGVTQYFIDGCFQSVLDEYIYTLTDGKMSSFDVKRKHDIYEMINDALSVRSNVYINNSFKTKQSYRPEHSYLSSREVIRCNYASSFANDGVGDENKARSASTMRTAFNSPFRPFVLSTTSIGQEGLDFHFYCRRLVHYNLPNNPIDVEQREGRIDRYKNLCIRQNLGYKYSNESFNNNVWDEIFEKEQAEVSYIDSSGLLPNWALNHSDKVKIERIIPIYPYSVDNEKYENIKRILVYYRLAIGQPNQDDIIAKLALNKEFSKKQIESLYLCLSPWKKKC